MIRNKARMFTLATFIQHCTGDSSQEDSKRYKTNFIFRSQDIARKF